MPSPVRTLAGLPLYRYNRESVERGLTAHFGGEGTAQGWVRNEKGYIVSTGRGLVRLKSVREAALFCVAAKEAKQRMGVDRETLLREMTATSEADGLRY